MQRKRLPKPLDPERDLATINPLLRPVKGYGWHLVLPGQFPVSNVRAEHPDVLAMQAVEYIDHGALGLDSSFTPQGGHRMSESSSPQDAPVTSVNDPPEVGTRRSTRKRTPTDKGRVYFVKQHHDPESKDLQARMARLVKQLKARKQRKA